MVGEEKHKKYNRVFSVGIGYGVSHLVWIDSNWYRLVLT